MEAALLVHSRTKYVDFNSNFAVRPKNLDVELARSKILPSTNQMQTSKGFRRVVAKNGDLLIVGFAVYFRKFKESDPDKKYIPVEKEADAKKIMDEAKNFFCDQYDRDVKIFIGYVFKGEGIPKIDFCKLWEKFKTEVQPVWCDENPSTIYSKYEEYTEIKELPSKPENFDKIKYYESSEETDKNFFELCISEKIDFCSNVNQYEIYQKGNYEIITATRDIINQLESEEKNNFEKKEMISQKQREKLNQQCAAKYYEKRTALTEGKLQDLTLEDLRANLKKNTAKFKFIKGSDYPLDNKKEADIYSIYLIKIESIAMIPNIVLYFEKETVSCKIIEKPSTLKFLEDFPDEIKNDFIKEEYYSYNGKKYYAGNPYLSKSKIKIPIPFYLKG